MVKCDRVSTRNSVSPMFRKSALALVIAATSHYAIAQEAASDDAKTIEEVVVFGIKQSLQNAQDIKRDAATVKDVITASDINSLPDKSVVDALKRVPGVQVEVFAATSDPEHFGAEGSTALVRGLNRTLTQFNGRSSFSARSGGGLDLSNIPSELVGAIEVNKNQTAEMIAGSIAGTLDLITRKPFDADGFQVGGSVKLTYGDLIEDTTPEFSGLLSNRWDTDIGEFGFLLSAAVAEFTQRSDGVGAHDFYERSNRTEPTADLPSTEGIGPALPGQEAETLWMPPAIQARFKEDARDRMGFSSSVQWADPGETVLATLEFIRSESTLAWHERLLQNRDSLGDQLGNASVSNLIEIEGISGVDESFDSETGLFTHGYISGAGYEAHTRAHHEKSYVNDISLDVEINVSDNIKVTTDLQYVKSEMRMRDHSIMNGFSSDVWLDLRDQDKPQVGFVGTGFGATMVDGEMVLGGDTTSITDGANVNLRSAMDHDTKSVGDSLAFSADIEYMFDDSWITSVKGGMRFSDRDQTHKETNYDWGNISPEWSEQHFRSAAEFPEFQELVDFSNGFHGGDGFIDSSVQQFLFPRLSLTRDLTQFEAQINSMSSDPSVTPVRNDNGTPDDPSDDSRWEYPAGHPLAGQYFDNTFIYTRAEGSPDPFVTHESALVEGKAYGDPFAPNEIFVVSEKRQAAYAQLNFASDDFLLPVRGNVGFRYVRIQSTSIGSSTFDVADGEYTSTDRYTEDTVVSGFPDANFPQDTTNLDRFLSGDTTTLRARPKAFSEVLPSFNVTFNLSEDVLLRLSGSKGIFVPEVVDLRNNLRVAPNVTALLVDPTDNTSPYESVTLNGYTATAVGDSNPYLQPEEAIMFDVSAEWYFSDVGSLTFVVFNKELDNMIRTSTTRQDITNPVTGATEQAVIRGKANVGEATINGFEFAYQQTFDFLPSFWSGFGMQANFTYLDTDEDVGRSADTSVFSTFTDLPLEGLSEESYNIVGFYETERFSTRLAYNWRKGYMLDDRDVIASRPVYNDDRGELDFSFSYNLTDSISAGLDINNLLNVQTNTLLQYNQSGDLSPRNYFENDRRLSLRLSGSF